MRREVLRQESFTVKVTEKAAEAVRDSGSRRPPQPRVPECQKTVDVRDAERLYGPRPCPFTQPPQEYVRRIAVLTQRFLG